MTSTISSRDPSRAKLTIMHGLHLACIAAALLLAPGVRAQADAPKPAPAAKGDAQPEAQPVRQKVVPLPADPSRGNGADWTTLKHPGNTFMPPGINVNATWGSFGGDPDVRVLLAHAGVGDWFPVLEEGKPKHFDVRIVSGSDANLKFEIVEITPNKNDPSKPEIRPVGRKEGYTVERDGTFVFDGHSDFKYAFSYPSVTVPPDGKVTTDKALIFVHRIPQNSAFVTSAEKGTLLYSMRFRGGNLFLLEATLKTAFPKDNIVIGGSAQNAKLDQFEILNVRLSEMGKTIEFLSEGKLTVEVVEKEGDMPGNIWRIGAKPHAGAAEAANLKMRSITAPHLFGDGKKVERMMKDAVAMEDRRVYLILNSSNVRNGEFSQVARTQIEPLSGQKVFVLIGTEDGVAGVESFIRAAEQLAVEEDAKKLAEKMAAEAHEKQEQSRKQAEHEAEDKAIKQRKAEEAAAKEALAAAIAPKMHAVAAPHLFASKERLERFTKEAGEMQKMWEELHMILMSDAGAKQRGHRMSGGINIQPRPEQKIFVLLGSEEGIAGLESLIQAAEKIAADEDAKILALKMAAEARDAADKAEAQRQKALDDKYRKGTPQNP